MSATQKSIFAPQMGEDRCSVVDRLPKALRGLVHEYGYSVVLAFHEAGVRDPNIIRHLIVSVWRGAREPGNKRPGSISAAQRGLNALDVTLTALGAGVPAIAVARHLRDFGFTLAPIDGPSAAMLEASMATVTNHDVTVDKAGKHHRRLTAALRAADADLWRAA